MLDTVYGEYRNFLKVGAYLKSYQEHYSAKIHFENKVSYPFSVSAPTLVKSTEIS